ncbi:histone H3 [Balamuthia mandrillaris]
MVRTKRVARKSTDSASSQQGGGSLPAQASSTTATQPPARPTLSRPLKKPHCFRPGAVALREIRTFPQHDLLVRRKAFERLAREMLAERSDKGLRFDEPALRVLQQAAEEYLIGFFSDANSCALHSKRINVQPKDMMLARRLRKEC